MLDTPPLYVAEVRSCLLDGALQHGVGDGPGELREHGLVEGNRPRAVDAERKIAAKLGAALSHLPAPGGVGGKLAEALRQLLVGVREVAVLSGEHGVCKARVPAAGDGKRHRHRLKHGHGVHLRQGGGYEYGADGIVCCQMEPVHKTREEDALVRAGLFCPLHQLRQRGSVSHEEHLYVRPLRDDLQADLKQLLDALLLDYAPHVQDDGLGVRYPEEPAQAADILIVCGAPHKALRVDGVRDDRRRGGGQYEGILEIVVRFLRDVDEGVEMLVRGMDKAADDALGDDFSHLDVVAVIILPHSMGRRDDGDAQLPAGDAGKVPHREFRVRMDELDVVLLAESDGFPFQRQPDVLVVADGRWQRGKAEYAFVLRSFRGGVLLRVGAYGDHDDVVPHLHEDAAQLDDDSDNAALGGKITV